MNEDHHPSSDPELAEPTQLEEELPGADLPGDGRLQFEGQRQLQRLEQLMFGVPAPTPTQLGSYQILGELGRGGMGVVYIGYDERLDRKVAIKTMKEQAEPAMQRLLESEARAMARLDHPNVATVYEIGVLEGVTFIAMEYVEGQTLCDWWGDEAPGRAELLRVFRAAGEGLIAAHDAGLVHRDFKPSNVMVSSEGRVVVLDFGLARTDPAHDKTVSWRPCGARHSRNNWRAGTPAYMAPEQFRGRWADTASDQFSFCVSLYEALYDERPFAGASCELRWAAAERADVRPAPASADVPVWLRELLIRGLAPRPSERFPSIRALLRELERGEQRELDAQLLMLEPASSLILERPVAQPKTERAEKKVGYIRGRVTAVMMTAAVSVVVTGGVVTANVLLSRKVTPELGPEGDERRAPFGEGERAPLAKELPSESEGTGVNEEEPGESGGLDTKTERPDVHRVAKSPMSVDFFVGSVRANGWFAFARIDGKHLLTLEPKGNLGLTSGRHDLEIRFDETDEWEFHCSFDVRSDERNRVVLRHDGC